MSAITDVGVNLKFEGGADFESRLKSLESSWKSFSSELEKAPQVQEHFNKMSAGIEHLNSKMAGLATGAKTAIAGLLAFEGAKKAFQWALGSEIVSKERAYTKSFMPAEEYAEYKKAWEEMRQTKDIATEDLISGAYQMNSAMAGAPLKERVEAFKDMAYYAFLLKGSFEQATIFYKKFLAEFGQSLPKAQQKTLSEDMLGYIQAAARESKVDPKELPIAMAKVAPIYKELGLGLTRMLADLSIAIPQFQSAEMAGTAITAIFSKGGEIMQKLAGTAYEESFVRGKAFDKFGRHGRDWGTLQNMETAAKGMGPLGHLHEQAKAAISEMHANKNQFEKDARDTGMALLKEKDEAGFFKMMRGYTDTINSVMGKTGGFAQIAKAMGVEHVAPMLTFIEDYLNKDIPKLEALITAQKGKSTKGVINKAEEEELPHAWKMIKQAISDLEGSFRPIFHDPLMKFLDGWRESLADVKKIFEGAEGIGKLKAISKAVSAGAEEGWTGKKVVQGVTEEKTMAQMFREWMEGLSVDDWREAGRKIGEAASDLAIIAKALRGALEVVSKWLSPRQDAMGKPVETAGLKGLWGGLTDFSLEKALLNQIPGLPGTASTQQAQADQFLSSKPPSRSPVAGALTPAAMSAPPGGWGLPSINVTSQPQVTINCDDKAIKDALKVEVKDEIKEDLQRDQDRMLNNGSDKER